MTANEPRHRRYDLSLSEWQGSLLRELDRDMVALYNIIPVLRGDFGLNEDGLKAAAEACIAALIERGAVVTEMPERYGSTPSDIASNIYQTWLRDGDEPILYQTWFELPESRARRH